MGSKICDGNQGCGNVGNEGCNTLTGFILLHGCVMLDKPGDALHVYNLLQFTRQD